MEAGPQGGRDFPSLLLRDAGREWLLLNYLVSFCVTVVSPALGRVRSTPSPWLCFSLWVGKR